MLRFDLIKCCSFKIDIIYKTLASVKGGKIFTSRSCTLNEALSLYPKPDIFNTDQGSQYTSIEFTNILKYTQTKSN